MTNFEYWKDELAKIAKTDDDIGILHGKPVECNDVCGCENCDRDGRCNEAALIDWLMQEHIEKSKLTKKERMFCELVETGWIARDKNIGLWWHNEKPSKGKTTWSSGFCSKLYPTVNFPFIKWEDKEPWSVEDLLKLEVE